MRIATDSSRIEISSEKKLEDIMNDPFWDILQMSWDEESACLPACSSTCSFKDEEWPNSYRVNIYKNE